MRLVESVGSASDAALAHEAARATVTLLKNAPPFAGPPQQPPLPPLSPEPAPPPSSPGGSNGTGKAEGGAAIGVEECDAYLGEEGGGCGWTEGWRCPPADPGQDPGQGDVAADDGSTGFACCCGARMAA